MHAEPKVSIIITTYNRPVYLKRAILSAQKQTYSNIEIIVVDDNNPRTLPRKETELLVSELNFTNLYYVRHESNKGANEARNTGLKHSKGDFVAFLDDDDEYLPNNISEKVKAASQFFNNNQGILIFSDYQVIGDELLNNSKWNIKIKNELYFPGLNHIYSGNFIGSMSFILVDKKSLLKIGGFDEALKSSQDWDLYIRLSQNNINFVGINKPLVRYHVQNDIQRITSNNDARIEGYLMLLSKNEKRLKTLPNEIRRQFHSYLFRRISDISLKHGYRFYYKAITQNKHNTRDIIYILLDLVIPIIKKTPYLNLLFRKLKTCR